MKSTKTDNKTTTVVVAPFAGAWIEIYINDKGIYGDHVAPFAGAWIEIPIPRYLFEHSLVAPFAGAWIEIQFGHTLLKKINRRSLRGSVD